MNQPVTKLNKQTYLLGSQKVRSYERLLEAHFKEPVESLLRGLYIEKEMSVADIVAYFVERVGVAVTGRQIYRTLSKFGIPRRNTSEHKRLSWKQGKMDSSIENCRKTRKRTYLLGSKPEHQVRFFLREAFLEMGFPWHVVIGDNLQHILARYEVDIPLVVLDPANNQACRFAIEVDHEFTHGDLARKRRDSEKEYALRRAGWLVYRLDSGPSAPCHLREQVYGLADLIFHVVHERFAGQSLPRSVDQR